MKKVLHLIKEYKGNYPLINSYVKALPRERYSSTVCYLIGNPDDNNELERFADVEYLRYEKAALKRLGPRVVFSLARMMRRQKIDIVHCHRHRPTVIGTLAAAVAGVPHVLSNVHGLGRTRSLGRRFVNKFIFRRISKVIAVADGVRQDVILNNRGINPEKVVTVRNGIDLGRIDSVLTSRQEARSMLGIKGNDLVFGSVGRLVRTKGHRHLIQAFSDVAGRNPNVRLVLVGDGNLRGELEDMARQLGIGERTVFTGRRTDVAELLRGFDVFVFPSLAEGLGLALLEAMASGLPFIASDVGGIPETLGDSAAGYLVPSADSLALARAMDRLISAGAEKRAEMGSRGRQRVEAEFTKEKMCEGIARVYDAVLSQGTGGDTE